MKRLLIIPILLISVGFIKAQTTLTLDDCYTKARENYPLIKQKDYIAQSNDYTVSNIWNGYFPQITLGAQWTYQSEVTTTPPGLSGIVIERLTLDQYKVFADVSQTIYDGGIMNSLANIQESTNEVENQKVEVELLKIKDRVNQIYFGILLLDAQLVQIDLVMNDLKASISKLESSYQNGIVTKSDVDVLKAELLKTEQRKIETNSSRLSYLNMLGLLINEPLDEAAALSTPLQTELISTETILRPELKVYSAQKNLINSQNGLTNSKIIPKASLFFQGGYSRPGLNMFKNTPEWYYITGIRFSWTLSNFYSYSNEEEINQLNIQNVDAQSEAFILNTNINANRQVQEIDKLKKVITVDDEIISFRTSIKEAAKAKLENGVITSNDFIRELNAEDNAKQNLSLHRIQLILAQYNYKITIGN